MTGEEQIQKLTAERDAALKQVAEMRDVLINISKFVPPVNAGMGNYKLTHKLIEQALSKSCGKGYVKAESLRCFKCDDGHTPLYCLNCARKGYHHDDEWRPVVEALRSIRSSVIQTDDNHYRHICGEWLGATCDKALAHAEKLTSQ